jgi:hypothetical protein
VRKEPKMHGEPLSGLRKIDGHYLPPNLGIWRVKRMINRMSYRWEDEEEGKDTAKKHEKEEEGKDTAEKHEKEEEGKDTAKKHEKEHKKEDKMRLWKDYEQLDRRRSLEGMGPAFARYQLGGAGIALCKEPSKESSIDYLEGMAIMEAKEKVFLPNAEALLQNSESKEKKKLMVWRAPKNDAFTPIDFYVDIYPCDVKTICPIPDDGERALKKAVNSLFHEKGGTNAGGINANRKKPNKKFKQRIKLAEDLKSMKDEEDKPVHDRYAVLCFEMKQGVYGGVHTVIDRVSCPAELCDVQSTGTVLGQCYPYVVVNTAFLTDRQVMKFWTLIDKMLEKNNITHLRYLIIEVHTCTRWGNHDVLYFY